mmetsp:Transcript_15758/g.22410  ORF Transcript_15758/g.22410 Transcript_15758/m.22410 type:complete len:80 (+) Transcript_15758:746-985(+)
MYPSAFDELYDIDLLSSSVVEMDVLGCISEFSKEFGDEKDSVALRKGIEDGSCMLQDKSVPSKSKGTFSCKLRWCRREV